MLRQLVDTLGAAYVDDRNLVAFPTAHPANCSGDARLLREADVILAVDVADLPGLLADRGRGDRAAAPATAALPAIVDLSAGDLAARSWSNAFAAPLPRTVQLLADPLAGLQAVIDALDGRRPDDALARSATQARARRAAVHERAAADLRAHWSDSPISPGRLVAETWSAVRHLDWLLTLRNTRSWPAGVWQFTGAGEYLGHSGGGGVGYGPGAMVGGALAARDRGQLGVAIVGDGDLLMASGALWTAAHYRIPMLVVVNDNGSFYNDEPHQADVARHRGRPAENSWIGMRIGDPAVDIAGLAASYGCAAHGPVEDPEKLPEVLRAATADAVAGAVAVVHVRTARG
jgi:acetolactate synthase-1/2/3 large subunit